jgi:hypothetical protein
MPSPSFSDRVLPVPDGEGESLKALAAGHHHTLKVPEDGVEAFTTAAPILNVVDDGLPHRVQDLLLVSLRHLVPNWWSIYTRYYYYIIHRRALRLSGPSSLKGGEPSSGLNSPQVVSTLYDL